MSLAGVEEPQLEVLPTNWAHVIMKNCDITNLMHRLTVDPDYKFVVLILLKYPNVWEKLTI